MEASEGIEGGDKNQVNLLNKQIQSLNDERERRERVLRSKDFVNQLYLAKIERLKAGKGNEGDDALTEAYTEIKELKRQLEHHPQVIRLAADCEELRGKVLCMHSIYI